MIKIRKYKKKDILLRVKRLNNPQVNKFMWDEPGKRTTLEEQQEWFKKYEKDENKKFFTICDDEKAIGFIGLSNISEKNKNADVLIAIGDDIYRGKWFGKKAMVWILDFAFKELNLNKVNLGVFKENELAVGLYQHLWFTIEWDMKEEVFFDWKFHNFLSMAIFHRDWVR